MIIVVSTIVKLIGHFYTSFVVPCGSPFSISSPSMRCNAVLSCFQLVALHCVEQSVEPDLGCCNCSRLSCRLAFLCVANVYHLMYPCVTMGRWLNSLIETLFNTPRSFIRIFAFFIWTLFLNFIFDSYFWFVRQLQAKRKAATTTTGLINKLKESVKIYYIAYRIV